MQCRLILPILSNLVHINNVISLANSNLGAVRGESNCFYKIALLSILQHEKIINSLSLNLY